MIRFTDADAVRIMRQSGVNRHILSAVLMAQMPDYIQRVFMNAASANVLCKCVDKFVIYSSKQIMIEYIGILNNCETHLNVPVYWITHSEPIPENLVILVKSGLVDLEYMIKYSICHNTLALDCITDFIRDTHIHWESILKYIFMLRSRYTDLRMIFKNLARVLEINKNSGTFWNAFVKVWKAESIYAINYNYMFLKDTIDTMRHEKVYTDLLMNRSLDCAVCIAILMERSCTFSEDEVGLYRVYCGDDDFTGTHGNVFIHGCKTCKIINAVQSRDRYMNSRVGNRILITGYTSYDADDMYVVRCDIDWCDKVARMCYKVGLDNRTSSIGIYNDICFNPDVVIYLHDNDIDHMCYEACTVFSESILLDRATTSQEFDTIKRIVGRRVFRNKSIDPACKYVKSKLSNVEFLEGLVSVGGPLSMVARYKLTRISDRLGAFMYTKKIFPYDISRYIVENFI
jgi:hypothetical protein